MEWATAQFSFFLFESQYNKIYCDRLGWEAARWGSPRHGAACHDTATAQPQYGQAAYNTAMRRRDTVGSSRGWELGRDTTIVSWLRGGQPCVAIQFSKGLQYDAQCPATRRRGTETRATTHDTARVRMALVLGVS